MIEIAEVEHERHDPGHLEEACGKGAVAGPGRRQLGHIEGAEEDREIPKEQDQGQAGYVVAKYSEH